MQENGHEICYMKAIVQLMLLSAVEHKFYSIRLVCTLYTDPAPLIARYFIAFFFKQHKKIKNVFKLKKRNNILEIAMFFKTSFISAFQKVSFIQKHVFGIE